MTLKVQHKRSAVKGKAPLPADLEYGEIAVNYEATDPALYIKDSADAIRKIGNQPAATETVAGIVELATAAETTTGTDATRAVHPAGLKVELDKKANLASPTFTGTPAAPTAAVGTNTTQVATTAFVHAADKWTRTGTTLSPATAGDTIQGNLVPTNGAFGTRNRIINGDMRIDQRNAGASVTVTSGGGYIYATDRFINFNSTGANYTAEQVEDGPAGFYQSTKLTFASAISLTTQNEATYQQIIEGNNLIDLGLGTANALTFTVSFWVKSSFTGTFSIGFANDGGTRAYATTYTINAANTWEYKTVTIPGDTTGTWNRTNGAGLFVRWIIAGGSNFNVSSNNAWETRSGAFNASNGIYGTKAIGSASSIATGSTFFITGVQLEPGTVATPFERRSYGQELALCQRYFESHASSTYPIISCTFDPSPKESYATWSFAVTKRAAPTLAVSSGSWAIAPDTITPGVSSVQFRKADNYFYLNPGSAVTASAEL